MKRIFGLAVLLVSLFCFSGPRAEAAAGPAVQITLYDLAKGEEKLVAVGRAALLPREQRAKMYVFSAQPELARLPYSRDVFFVTRTKVDMRTGAVSFRVRFEQIIKKRCTALDTREYFSMRPGDSCELYSDRGQIRAVMQVVQ